MAAFSAVVCLEQLLGQLLNSDHLPKEEVVSLHGKISSLRSSLQIIFPAPKRERYKANCLADQIRSKIFETQDTIESFIFSTQNQPSESSKTQSLTSISLQKIIANIDPITEEAKKLSDAIAEAKKWRQPDYESPAYEWRSVGQRTKIVGQEKDKAEIEKKLLAMTGTRLVIPICGMPGIGKTTLANSIYEDARLMRNFTFKAWVTVSQDANIKEILGKLLHSLESRDQKAGDNKYKGDEAKLRAELNEALSNNKYLVVIDDLWDPEIWMRLRAALPDNENSSRVLITTRSSNVANSVQSTDGLEMQALYEEDSWTLLRNRTFGDDKGCPTELKNIGRNIAKHCKGLPLSLTVIGGLLSQGSKEAEYWQSIAEDTYGATASSRIEEAYLDILCLSYDNLPCTLRCCFLYMAAFHEGSDISLSKLIMLCIAEGFFTALTQPGLLEKVAEQSLLDLVDRNLVVIRRKGSDGRIKAVGIHSSLRDLAEKESARERFFHSRKRYSQEVVSDTNTQRRVFVHNNILMCLEHVYDSTKTITNARSLLYIGPYHHQPMPSILTFDLLRVLDAFTVLFIRFPNEILKLIYLRYLSFTYNGKLPSRLSRLHNLQVLIVKRQPKIIYVGTPFLPDEIWNMKELRHLIITETDLPLLSLTEPAGSILFENLQTLSNVNAASCTQEVLGNMPNLKRLEMWVEAPGKVGLYLNKLDQLEVFRLAVLNPIPGKMIEFGPKLFFPNTVRKLCLSGCGLPWEDMEVIAKLPNLQVLKLKKLAFHGEEWCPNYDFRILKFLLIEYLNLKRWEAYSSKFPCLEQLIIKHCYELEELPLDMEELEKLRLIELVDCSPEATEDYGIEMLQVRIHSSWE